MYNPRLKDKHALVDLARYGTEARKSIHPDVLIGEHCVKCPPFREGDILDANATVNLIGDTLNGCEIFQTFDEEGQRIAERLDNLEQTQSENYTELSDKVDSLTETHEQDITRLDDKTDNLALNIINQERVVDISKLSEVGGNTSYLVTKQDGSHDTIIVAKGDKGDQGESFSYEDFTPEQLEALKVKGDKGDKGTSITRVQQTTVAYNDRGVNVVTIDLDDGSSSLIQIRNGAPGKDPQVRQDLQAEIARATSAENALLNNINSVNSRVDHIVEDAPEALDTLLEIAEKLHDEEDAVAALTLEISLKYTKPATGIPSSDMSEAVRASLSKADTALQQHQDISGKADLADLATVATTGEYSDLLNKPVIPTIPTNVSAFTNDVGYLTEHQDISGKANTADLSSVAFSGDYVDLNNTPTIPVVPTNVSSFTNDAGYLTLHQDISGKANIADLATVATSGSYDDLADKPTIPSLAGYATEQWVLNQNYLTEHQDISGKADIADLSNVAFSGDYEDLSNTPTIPTVPTNVSAFTNDAGYLTLHQDISGKQDVISDLDTIRSGAQAGSTALQPNALNDYYNKTQVDNKLSEKQDTISDLATIRTGAGMGATALQPSALNNYYNKDQVDTKLSSKQDTINNLATIEAGAAKGATSLLPSDKGVAGGVATLDVTGKVPSGQLPEDADTKNTAGSTNTTDKLFIIGSKTQNNNPLTYSNVGCYVENGRIYSNNSVVVTASDDILGLSYGIQWTSTNATPIRRGNMEMHRTLPIQNKMRRCMLLDDGTVYGYIDPKDYTKYTDGSTVDYSGAHGQYMVEIPEYWYIGTNEDGVRGIDIYPSEVEGVLHSPKCYISAVEATSNDASSDTLKKLFSICDATILYNEDGSVSANAIITYSTDAADHRGGNRNTGYDGIKTLLGRPVTSLTRSAFRTRAAARGTGWSLQYWKAYMAWVRLFVVEYCTFNSQANYNATKTTEGYMQGGLGAGVSTVNGTAWSNFNGYNPFVPCGVTKRLGNSTGVVTYKFEAGEFTTTAVEVSVPSYRGIENPFGHIWKWTDGVNIYCDEETHKSTIYTCDDITKFADNTSTDYVLRTADCYQGTSGYIKDWLIDGNADFLPLTIGGSAGSYLYDYSWFNNTGWRVLGSSGHAGSGTSCGLFCFSASSDSSNASAVIGGRLYYTPSE